MSNIREIPTKPDEGKAALDQFRRALPYLVGMAEMTMKVRLANYNAAIAEGFTPEQALTLCMKTEL